jgi:AbrB family looped-hinge helix DNA binding protein
MATAIVTPEGYIDLPKDIREQLHLRAGDTLDIEMEKDHAIRMRPKTLKPSDVSGMLASRSHTPNPIANLDEALAEAFRKGGV